MKSNSTTRAVLLHLLFLLGSIYATDNEKKRYDGYRLYKVFVSDTTGLELLRNMYDDDGYHLWHPPSINNTAEVMIAPAKIQEFMEKVNGSRLEPELMMDDVQRYIDDENPRGNVRGGFDWLGYHRLDSIYSWLDSLVTQYPKIVKPITGGNSYEGRSIRGVKISYKEGNPGIFIEGGIHAREWISPAVVTYVLNELILSDDSRVRYMAESYDWYIFPVFNPDGYEYTHTTNRLWRKTRRPSGRGCYGADPNRNWNFHWAGNDELRDTGRYGFILPASQIIPTAKETLDSLVVMFQQAAKLGYGTSTNNST